MMTTMMMMMIHLDDDDLDEGLVHPLTWLMQGDTGSELEDIIITIIIIIIVVIIIAVIIIIIISLGKQAGVASG